MDDPKPPILTATNNGLSIFEYFIPELKLQGTGKNFRALFRDDGHSPDAKVFFNDRGHCWCYHDFVSGETLNPFDFVMKFCKCSFKDALEIIRRDILFDGGEVSKPKAVKGTTILNFKITPCENISYWFDFAP